MSGFSFESDYDDSGNKVLVRIEPFELTKECPNFYVEFTKTENRHGLLIKNKRCVIAYAMIDRTIV